MDPVHFKGKSAIDHVAEAQAKGILASSEIHGTELPGHISAAADSARETGLIFLLITPLLLHFSKSPNDPFSLFLPLFLFLIGWTLWRGARSAWLGWARLERLHRILEQEKWEIEHNRAQEKEELKELYRAKGFEGKLLDDVIDTLMADGDRLLRVMVEEELGLSLESQEHPLKQGVGAAVGTLAAGLLILTGLFIAFPYGLLAGAFLSIAISSSILAHYTNNRQIPAIVWNLAMTALSFGVTYFTIQIFT